VTERHFPRSVFSLGGGGIGARLSRRVRRRARIVEINNMYMRCLVALLALIGASLYD